MTSNRKPLNALHVYPGKELEQLNQYFQPSRNPVDDMPPSDGPPQWFLGPESTDPANTLPGTTSPGNALPGPIPPIKTLQDSLLNQPAQPTANSRPMLQFYGKSLRDRPGYVSPPRRGPTLAKQDGVQRRQRWYPSDDDLVVYGRRIEPETGTSPNRSEISSTTYPPDMPQVSRDLYGEGQVRQNSSVTGAASSPRTEQELQTLQIMAEVNPQGFQTLARHMDRAKGSSTQYRTRSASPSDQLRDRYANDLWRPGTTPGNKNDQEDESNIRSLFPGVLRTYGPLVGTPTPQGRLKYELSSLSARRVRRAASPAMPVFSLRTPPFGHGRNNLDRAEPSTHNSAERSHGLLSNPKKRARKASKMEDSTPPRREFLVLRDEILDNPSKKRRVSSHLVRESGGARYNANMGSTRRRSDSSISKTSNATPTRRLSLRNSGSFRKTNVDLLETPTQAARIDANASETQSNISKELFTTSDESAIQNSNHPTRAGTSNKSQKSSQPSRRSTRLSALRRELTDQLPYKEEQPPETTYTPAAVLPEAVADDSVGTSIHGSADKAQYTTANLDKDRPHVQSGRVSKSTATKKSKGLAASQLPQRRSHRIGKRRL